MQSCSAVSRPSRFGFSACTKATVVKTAIGLSIMVGAALITGDSGWFKLAAVLAFFSSLAVGLQVLAPGSRSHDNNNTTVNRHAF